MKKAIVAFCGALAAIVLLGAFFLSPPGRMLWLLTVFPAMTRLDAAVHLPFNPWHLFSASETIVLSNESGPDPDVAGSAARAREMAKLWYLVGKYKDVDDSVDIIDPGSGRTVEIVCRTWHPSDSRDLARTFRRLYERMTEEAGIADAAEFVTANAWGELDIEPSVRLPPPSDAPYAPVLDATAQSLAARDPRDAEKMLGIVVDKVWLAEIYAAREQNTLGISSKDLAEKIPGAEFYPDFAAIAENVRKEARPGDMILTVGAGDVYKIGEMLAEK